ncbi:MAG: hypothetical protein WC981_03140 [Candidatus Dojkabacteria bacterium]
MSVNVLSFINDKNNIINAGELLYYYLTNLEYPASIFVPGGFNYVMDLQTWNSQNYWDKSEKHDNIFIVDRNHTSSKYKCFKYIEEALEYLKDTRVMVLGDKRLCEIASCFAKKFFVVKVKGVNSYYNVSESAIALHESKWFKINEGTFRFHHDWSYSNYENAEGKVLVNVGQAFRSPKLVTKEEAERDYYGEYVKL